MLTHIEIPLLIEQLERAKSSSNISSENQMFIAELRGRLLVKGNKTRIKASEIDRLDDIFCETGVYRSLNEDGSA